MQSASTRREKHINPKIAGCGFHHVAIRSSDWDKSVSFYTEGLGFSVAVQWGDEPRRACLLDLGDGNYLEIFEREPMDSPAEGNIMHFCLRVDDVDAAVACARAAGAEVTTEPRSPDVFTRQNMSVRIAFIKGPDGEVCEFFECDAL